MSDPSKMGNIPGHPMHDPHQVPYNDSGQHLPSSEPTPTPPGTSVPPPSEVPPEERNPPTLTPTGLRDFEGRRLYFANVCASVSPHALHCIFRSYGPLRSFHYDTTFHCGYVVYMEREQALIARYEIDGLIIGTRAIRVYYPPYKPRHPTRYCYNCRGMGHFIQSCPYTPYNNWDYSYAQQYNLDHINHPSSPMMHHYAGHMGPPNQPYMFPGPPPNSATLMYQPGWPGVPPTSTMQFMPPFMGPQQPIPPGHPHHPMTPHPPVVPPQMHQQFMHQPPPPQVPQPPPPMPMPPQPLPNINALIQEHATAIIQQHLTPIVQQVVAQIMQDPAMISLQNGMANTGSDNTRSGSYTVNEEPETASGQSFPTMEEPVNTPVTQMAQFMHNLPMQESNPEYVELGKMMQNLLHEQCAPRTENGAAYRPRCNSPEHSVSHSHRSETYYPVGEVPRPITTVGAHCRTTTVHNGSTVTSRPQQYSSDNMQSPESHTRDSSSSESRQHMPDHGMQHPDSQFYPQYPYNAPPPPFSLPSSIFFTLPPIVVNITSPAPCFGPPVPNVEQKASFPPPYESLPNAPPQNYEFIDDYRDFEEEVRAHHINTQEIPMNPLDQPGPSSQQPLIIPDPPRQSTGATPRPPKPAKFGKRIIKDEPSTSRERLSERERLRQDRMRLREMLLEENDQDAQDIPELREIEEIQDYENNASAMLPLTQLINEVTSAGDSPVVYSELVSTMNTSSGEIEKLFMSLANLVGNPLAKKYLDQIRTLLETEILKLSQMLLRQIVDKDKPPNKEEIINLSNTLTAYANQRKPSTSAAAAAAAAAAASDAEGAVGGDQNPEETRSEVDSRKEDSDDGPSKRKNNHGKKKKNRR